MSNGSRSAVDVLLESAERLRGTDSTLPSAVAAVLVDRDRLRQALLAFEEQWVKLAGFPRATTPYSGAIVAARQALRASDVLSPGGLALDELVAWLRARIVSCFGRGEQGEAEAYAYSLTLSELVRLGLVREVA